jgi:uncharacterized Fe-S center protein
MINTDKVHITYFNILLNIHLETDCRNPDKQMPAAPIIRAIKAILMEQQAPLKCQ